MEGGLVRLKLGPKVGPVEGYPVREETGRVEGKMEGS